MPTNHQPKAPEASCGATEAPSQDPRFLCHHLFDGSRNCGSPALRGEAYCYFHHPTRRPPTSRSRRELRRARFVARQPFELPSLLDPRNIQLALGEVVRRLASNQLDVRRARVLLDALHTAAKRR